MVTGIKQFFYDHRNDYIVFTNAQKCAKRKKSDLNRLKLRKYITQQLNYLLPIQITFNNYYGPCGPQVVAFTTFFMSVLTNLTV